MERKITSVGIDVSKGKSTVCILRPYGEIISTPFEVQHTEDGLREFTEKLQRLDGEIRVTMEGYRHLSSVGIFIFT